MTFSTIGQGLRTAASMLVPPSDPKGVALMGGAACLTGKVVTAFGVSALGLPTGGLLAAGLVSAVAGEVFSAGAGYGAGVAYNTFNHFAG